MEWKDKNGSSVANGIITVTEEVAQNLHLMPQTSGKTNGGNQILRYVILETMLEGSSELRRNLTNNQLSGNGNLPRRVDPNHKAKTGFARERNNELEQLSKEELINMLLKNIQNFNNQFN